jgi:hypothetical protein
MVYCIVVVVYCIIDLADLISFAVLLAFLPSLPRLLLPAGTVGVFALKASLLSTRLAL